MAGMLRVTGINAFYNNFQALYDVSITLEKGEIVSIIGSNGAGKTTLMKSIMGMVHVQKGKFEFDGTSISDVKTHRIIKRGLVYVPEGREIFGTISVQDNLEMGAYSCKYSHKELQKHFDEVYDIFPRLGERRKQLGASLSGGEQQMLALGRALMSSPQVVMLDEPSLGLAPIIVNEVFEIIKRINTEKGISVLLVEQNAFMAIQISNRCYVLENGHVNLSGKSTDILHTASVRAAYLGG